MAVTLIIQDMAGHQTKVEVGHDMRVADAKAMLAQQTGQAPTSMLLVMGDRVMFHYHYVKQYLPVASQETDEHMAITVNLITRHDTGAYLMEQILGQGTGVLYNIWMVEGQRWHGVTCTGRLVFQNHWPEDDWPFDKELAMVLVHENPELLKELPKAMVDFDVSSVAVSASAAVAFRHVPEAMRKYKPMVLRAVQHDGLALQWASDDMKNDLDVVTAAVGENFQAMAFASTEMQGHPDVIQAALTSRPRGTSGATPRVRLSGIRAGNDDEFQ
jgi:Domain of unknown function (DUF4116)